MRDRNGINRRPFDLDRIPRRRPTDPIIGHRIFTDGVERAVHLSAERGQYVLDEGGMPVYGVWLLTEPVERPAKEQDDGLA